MRSWYAFTDPDWKVLGKCLWLSAMIRGSHLVQKVGGPHLKAVKKHITTIREDWHQARSILPQVFFNLWFLLAAFNMLNYHCSIQHIA